MAAKLLHVIMDEFVWGFMNCTPHMMIKLQPQIYHVVCAISHYKLIHLGWQLFTPSLIMCTAWNNQQFLYATQIDNKSHQIRVSFHVGCLPAHILVEM